MKITASIRRALRVEPTVHRDETHFHYGPNGLRPCDHAHCESPGVSARELGA